MTNRQHILDQAAAMIRDSGASVVSIIAKYPDGDEKTTLIIPRTTPGPRGLGKGLSAIRKTGKRQNRAVGVLKRGK